MADVTLTAWLFMLFPIRKVGMPAIGRRTRITLA